MTPDELLLQLRDIHLPDTALSQLGSGFSWLPFACLAVVLLVLLWIRYRRSRIWLHQARKRLKEIGASIDATPADNADAQQQHNTDLQDLAKQIAPYRAVTPFPAAVFLPPEKINNSRLKQIHDHLHQVVDS